MCRLYTKTLQNICFKVCFVKMFTSNYGVYIILLLSIIIQTAVTNYIILNFTYGTNVKPIGIDMHGDWSSDLIEGT